MKIPAESIPEAAVEAAVMAWLRHPGTGAEYIEPAMRSAIAAALGVALGEPVAYMQIPTGVVYRVPVDEKCDPLYTINNGDKQG